MASITIPDLPAWVRDEMAIRAAAAGQSLEGYLRGALIELACGEHRQALVPRIAERKRRTAATLSASQILRHLDAGRR